MTGVCSKRCQLVRARSRSGAGAPILQGTKRDAPVTKSVGTGGHAAPEGIVEEGRGGGWGGGQTLLLKTEGVGCLTLWPSPPSPSCESSGELGPEAEPGGSSHRCPWARGWDALGRPPGSPTSVCPIKSRCGSCQSSPHPFDTRPHPLHIYICIHTACSREDGDGGDSNDAEHVYVYNTSICFGIDG